MKFTYKAATALISVAALWVIIMSALSLFGNGTFYHIEQPVRVLDLDDAEIMVRVERSALLDMPATCSRELECDERVYQFASRPCPVESGNAAFSVALPIPDSASGVCIYRGIITYRPVGALGPDMSYAWETERFNVRRAE